jgi:hypothetical protein
MADMRRREFITLLGGAAAVWPLAARAQPTAKVVRVGVLAGSPLPPLQRFSRKLQDFGYVDGKNLHFEYRFAEGREDRYPAMAGELDWDASVTVDQSLGKHCESRPAEVRAASSPGWPGWPC